MKWVRVPILRTIDTHLARVYRKLGITSRSELGSALGTGGDR